MAEHLKDKADVENLLTTSIKHCQQMLELYKQYQSGLICSYELMDGIVLRKQSTVRSIEEAQRALMK